MIKKQPLQALADELTRIVCDEKGDDYVTYSRLHDIVCMVLEPIDEEDRRDSKSQVPPDMGIDC